MPIAVAALGGNAIVSERGAAAVDLRLAPLALVVTLVTQVAGTTVHA